jgi:pSer/pThr/pTyr-binding forkhead associated (FHA) protein
MPRLRIAAGAGGAAAPREITLGDRLTIGRVEGVDLVLDDKGCSRRHCEIVKEAAGFVLRDLGSSNGTQVNGEKVTERTLADGDTIRIGNASLSFLARDADFALRFESGEHAGREVALTAARTTLGRRPDNALSFNDVKVSGVHVEIVRDGDGFVLRDLGSTNGTLLDGRKITEVALGHGDRVQIGANDFQFVDLRKGTNGDASSAALPDRAPELPPRKGKAAAVVGLLATVLALGGGAAWYFLFSRGEGGPKAGRRATPAPEGTLLDEDWSFEDAAATAAIWSAEAGDGFSVRRGKAANGSSALGATFQSEGETQGVAVARRQAEEVSGGRTLRFTGQLSAESGALVGAGLRFLRSGDDAGRASALTLVAARSVGDAFTPFDVAITAPVWAKLAEVVLVGRGKGTVLVDDLALVPGGNAPAAAKLGDLQVLARGPGAIGLDHRASLAELFEPGGTVAGDGGARIELPAPAFAADARVDGANFTLEPGAAPFGAEWFSAQIAPEVAAAGAVLMTATSSEERFGAFAPVEARAVLIGGAAERFEIELDPPAPVSAVARGDVLELRVAPKAATKVKLRAGFEAERKEASDLFASAKEDWRAGKGGAALQKLKELRNRLPFDEQTLELARKLDAEIVPTVSAELNAIDSEAEAAEFLGSLERWQKTLARAETLLSQVGAVGQVADLEARVAKMRATVATMQQKRREEEARRLLKLARAYQSFGGADRKLTASELLAELQKSYADTAAAKEAAGEGGK